MTFLNATVAVSAVRGGKLRALGITGRRRIDALPDVPTLEEASVPGLDLQYWAGSHPGERRCPSFADCMRKSPTLRSPFHLTLQSEMPVSRWRQVGPRFFPGVCAPIVTRCENLLRRPGLSWSPEPQPCCICMPVVSGLPITSLRAPDKMKKSSLAPTPPNGYSRLRLGIPEGEGLFLPSPSGRGTKGEGCFD